MGMPENWRCFIQITKSKSKRHMQAALFWDTIHTTLSLLVIFLGAATTFLSLIKSVPPFAISSIAAATTLVSAINAFMRPHDRRQKQAESANQFKVLMMRMVRCELEREYGDLWHELNKAMFDEPFLPKEHVNDNLDLDWTVTPELQIVMAEKDGEVAEKFDYFNPVHKAQFNPLQPAKEKEEELDEYDEKKTLLDK